MKKYLAALTIFLFSAVAAMAQSDIIRQFENIKGTSIVSISKAMLKIAGPTIGDTDIASLSSKLDHLDVVSSENKTAIKSIKMIVDKNTEIAKSENLVNINDDNEKVTIKYRQNEDGTYSYFIITDSEDEYNLIILTGTMTLEDIVKYANMN